MTKRKRLKIDWKRAAFGIFFVVLTLVGGAVGPLAQNAMAEENAPEIAREDDAGDGGQNNGAQNSTQNGQNNQAQNNTQSNAQPQATQTQQSADNCQQALGAIGWLICPTTGKLAEAVDWLYDKLEGILTLNPVKLEDGSPIYEIWKVCLNIANIVFVIFLLIVIYSQLTGVGINNYGVKKALPKLIIVAILVNLSYVMCSLAVDVSNVVGNGVRGIFAGVEETVATNAGMSMHLNFGEILVSLVGGGALAVGATWIAFESGTIWMLIPVVLGAVVAVVIGIITIALRQAVVMLLIMIAPLAVVAYMLPNTEPWFQRWRKLFGQMLVFYPMFSLLFGASQLAGFAIISSAKDGFGLLLGAAVQVFPLFFSVQLMKMSGNFLGAVNAKMHSLAAGPLATNRAWAARQAELSRARHLAGPARTPSMRLLQFMSNRRVMDAEDTAMHQQTVKNRGLAYRARRNYDQNGRPTRRAERAYAEQADNMRYQRTIMRDKNNFNKGLGSMAAAGTPSRARLEALDKANMEASDYLKVEQARGETIGYENAKSYQERMTRAMNAHLDMTNGFEQTTDADGNTVLTPKPGYRFHSDAQRLAESEDLARYNAVRQIVDGSRIGTQLAMANAAQFYDTERKVLETKMQKYADLTVPTKEIDMKLEELTRSRDAIKNIDPIIASLRILNQRGDKDLVQRHIQAVLDQGVELGTHASQALGNFLMFEVGGGDPFLRRFGKYINLETAMVYSAGKRTNPIVTMDEMVTGQYEQINPETGEVEVKNSKMDLATLMQGTPLDSMERKALDNLEEMLKHPYTRDGHLDVQRYLDQRKPVEASMYGAMVAASLKFLSGSDELKSIIAFKTGIGADGKARWEAGGDLAEDAEYAERYFREQTIAFLMGQTPKSLLAIRSDFYEPLREHLSNQYIVDDMDKWSDEERQQHAERMARMAAIATSHMDQPPEKRAELRQQDMDELRDEMAGAEFRQLLKGTGKLAQIYRTRRSGAANNTKDWMRRWLLLDDERAINDTLREINNAQPEERREEPPVPEAEVLEEVEVGGGFNAEDRQAMADAVQQIFNHWQVEADDDTEEFYERTIEYLRGTLHGVEERIVRQYGTYRINHPDAEARELMEVLQDLVRDEGNY